MATRDGKNGPVAGQTVTPEMLEKARQTMLAESRALNPTCGCEKRGSRQFCCQYHEGMDDGFDDGYALAASAVQDAVSECAKIADGMIGATRHEIAAALREKYGVKP